MTQEPEQAPEPASVPRSIWRNHDFLKLWSGATISMFGSNITGIALPLLATVTLGASAAQMATLYGLQYLPNLLVLPFAAAAGILRMELLYVVAVLIGVFSVFANAADNAYLPALVGREHLVEANAKLTASGSVAGVAGPGIAGLLIDLVRAPGAIIIDALSFLVSAGMLSLIRKREAPAAAPAERGSIWAEIGEGLRTFYRNPVLRAFLCATVTYDVFWNALFALYFLYVTRELGLPATAIGLIFGAGSAGALIGAVLTARITRIFGVGYTIIGTQILMGLLAPLIALPLWMPAIALPVLVAAEFMLSLTNSISSINRGSLIQALVPNRLLGRVWASKNFIGLGIVPVGALLGGILGERIGVPATIVVGACGSLPSFLWLLFSPVRHIRSMPPPTEE